MSSIESKFPETALAVNKYIDSMLSDDKLREYSILNHELALNYSDIRMDISLTKIVGDNIPDKVVNYLTDPSALHRAKIILKYLSKYNTSITGSALVVLVTTTKDPYRLIMMLYIIIYKTQTTKITLKSCEDVLLIPLKIDPAKFYILNKLWNLGKIEGMNYFLMTHSHKKGFTI